MATAMDDEITKTTYDRVSYLICEYARLCDRTNKEVAQALVSSKTLKRHGYRYEQKGHLTESQGRAAIRVLNYWIGAKIGADKPR